MAEAITMNTAITVATAAALALRACERRMAKWRESEAC